MVAANPMAVIAEPRRHELVRLLWHGERTAGELNRALPDISFGAVSQHLSRLRGAGIVDVRKQGRSRIYRVNRDALGPLAAALDQMWGYQLHRLKELAEAEHKKGKRHDRRA